MTTTSGITVTTTDTTTYDPDGNAISQQQVTTGTDGTITSQTTHSSVNNAAGWLTSADDGQIHDLRLRCQRRRGVDERTARYCGVGERDRRPTGQRCRPRRWCDASTHIGVAGNLDAEGAGTARARGTKW